MKLKKLILSILLTCITICAASTMSACNKAVTYNDCVAITIYSANGDEIASYSKRDGMPFTVIIDSKGVITVKSQEIYRWNGTVIKYDTTYYNATCRIYQDIEEFNKNDR